MAFEMIDRQIWFPKTDCEAFGDGRTDHERAGEAGAAGRSKGIDIWHIDPGDGCGAFE